MAAQRCSVCREREPVDEFLVSKDTGGMGGRLGEFLICDLCIKDHQPIYDALLRKSDLADALRS